MPTITITRAANGTLQYTSAGANAKVLKIKPAEKLSWTSPDGQIAILFKNVDSPFECKKYALAADLGEETLPLKIKSLKTAEKPAQTFHYWAVHLDTANAFVTDDPDIIIDDPPAGSGSSMPAGAPAAAMSKPAAKPAKKPAKKVAKKAAKKAGAKKK